MVSLSAEHAVSTQIKAFALMNREGNNKKMKYRISENLLSDTWQLRIIGCLAKASIVLVLMFGADGSSWAVETGKSPNEHGDDPLGRDSPQGSIVGFLHQLRCLVLG